MKKTLPFVILAIVLLVMGALSWPAPALAQRGGHGGGGGFHGGGGGFHGGGAFHGGSGFRGGGSFRGGMVASLVISAVLLSAAAAANAAVFRRAYRTTPPLTGIE